jgi:hypothetical protein
MRRTAVMMHVQVQQAQHCIVYSADAITANLKLNCQHHNSRKFKSLFMDTMG